MNWFSIYGKGDDGRQHEVHTDNTGNVYTVAGGGGGGGGIVQQGAKDVSAVAWLVDRTGTQPVSIASMPSTPVTGTFWQGTQPVSLATNTPDVTDRSGRLLGHVTVDAAPTTAVTGTFWQATQPVSATSLPLPAGAAIESGGNLAAISANTPPTGRALMTASSPVTMASDQVNDESRYSRRSGEYLYMQEADAFGARTMRHSSERITQTDRRGCVGRGITR